LRVYEDIAYLRDYVWVNHPPLLPRVPLRPPSRVLSGGRGGGMLKTGSVSSEERAVGRLRTRLRRAGASPVPPTARPTVPSSVVSASHHHGRPSPQPIPSHRRRRGGIRGGESTATTLMRLTSRPLAPERTRCAPRRARHVPLRSGKHSPVLSLAVSGAVKCHHRPPNLRFRLLCHSCRTNGAKMCRIWPQEGRRATFRGKRGESTSQVTIAVPDPLQRISKLRSRSLLVSRHRYQCLRPQVR
jgi:hypothetical protein